MRNFYFIFCLFIFCNAYAQPKKSWVKKGYKPGFIITNEQDTLHGYLKDRTTPPFMKLYKNVRMKSHDRGVSGGYSPNEISGYCIKGHCFKSMWYHEESFFFNTTYYSLEGEGEKIFMRIIIDGYLSLYHKEYLDADNNYLQYISFFKRKDEYRLQRATQGILGLKKKQLSLYFKDCPSLIEKMNNNEFTTSLELVNYYNQWIEDKHRLNPD